LITTVVRFASAGDECAMGEVHVRAWQAAYRGIMSDALLDSLAPSRSAEGWGRAIADAGAERAVFVAEDAGRIVGFAGGGPAIAPEQGVLELYALNVDPAQWGFGAGSALLDRFVAWSAEDGARALMLRVLRENVRARRFYERRGWIWDGSEQPRQIFGAAVIECVYRRKVGA
jgi:GNAT superfamily N-acetyltransferase